MSVWERIEDSKLLFAAGKLEGALVSVLLAIAGTSRKRYPRTVIRSDGKAFKKFLEDERPKITGGPAMNFEINGKMWSLEAIFYDLIRNSLIHESELTDKISFEYGDFLLDKRGTTDHFVFSSELIILLSFIVATVPENKGIFPEGKYDGLPEPADLKQFAKVKYQWGNDRFDVYCSACTIVDEVWEETGERIKWLHMKAWHSVNGQISNPGVKILVPAKFVTSFEAGPQYRRTKKRHTCDVGIFPPDKPVPDGALPLAEIEKVLSELHVPMVATTITLYRPHYDLRTATRSILEAPGVRATFA